MARKSASAQPTSATERTLWKHQQETLSFLRKTPCGFDFSDPGTGKTAVQIAHYATRPKPRGRCLVLSPMTLMRSAWGKDFEQFAPELSVSYAYAGAERARAFELATDVVIMNVDGVKWLVDNKALLKGFDHLIIDEITVFKHSTSQRSKAIAKLRKLFKFRYGMTGTPNPNSVTELWHPSLIIDDGKRLGLSFFKFRAATQTSTQIGPSAQHLRWDDKPGAAQAVHAELSSISIRHEFESVMTSVPANFQHFKSFQLSKRSQQAYDRMENDCILALENSLITAVHAASLRTKLLQIASGAVYSAADGDDSSGYTVVDVTRYELITELALSVPHSVVFFNWRHQRDLLCKAFESEQASFAVIDGSTNKFERDRIVRDYQAGAYRTLLLHPRTGAHGLTLTRGTMTIFSSPIYEADMMKQGIARIYRGGQTEVTNTVFVEAEGTVERAVYERLQGKYANMQDLLDMLKQRSKRPGR